MFQQSLSAECKVVFVTTADYIYWDFRGMNAKRWVHNFMEARSYYYCLGTAVYCFVRHTSARLACSTQLTPHAGLQYPTGWALGLQPIDRTLRCIHQHTPGLSSWATKSRSSTRPRITPLPTAITCASPSCPCMCKDRTKVAIHHGHHWTYSCHYSTDLGSRLAVRATVYSVSLKLPSPVVASTLTIYNPCE